FFSSRRRHTRSKRDWSSDVCSSDLPAVEDDARHQHRQAARGAAPGARLDRPPRPAQTRAVLPVLVGLPGAARARPVRRRAGAQRQRGPGTTARSRQRPGRTAGLSAKEEILARLRTALDAPRPDEITTAEDIPRDYQRADHKQETSTDPTKIRNLLVRRLEDYTAVVHRTTSSQAPAAIATALGDAEHVVVPTALPPEWTREL